MKFFSGVRWLGAQGLPVLLLIILLISAIYWPVLDYPFLHWDDYTYIYANPYLKSLDWAFVQWALTTHYFANWHPLTWLSYGFDVGLWGMDAGYHHLTNLLLYGAEALGVYGLTRLLLKTPRIRQVGDYSVSQAHWAGLIAAVVFVVHPQHVEVVAWVSERKDLLCGVMTLLTLLTYLQYGLSEQRHWWLLSVLCFMLAILSKPMAVTLPWVLMVLDYNPLCRLRRDNWVRRVVIEKWPFFLLSGLATVHTLLAQEASGTIQALPLGVRLANIFNNSLFYGFHWVWPVGLSPFYPFPNYIQPLTPLALLPPVLFILLVGVAIHRLRAGNPHVLTVGLIYLLTLLPVIGIVHAGAQAAADRYAHLTTLVFYPVLGIWMMQHGSVASTRKRQVGVLVILIAIGLLTRLSQQQVVFWRSDFSLWQAVIQRYPNRVHLAHSNLGNVYFEAGQYDAALQQYLTAQAIEPRYHLVYSNLRAVYEAQQQRPAALELMHTLSQRHPDLGIIQQTLGDIERQQGNTTTAQAAYQRALQLDPTLASSHLALAQLFVQQQQLASAVTAVQQALKIAPDYVDAMLLLASLYEVQGKFELALAWYGQGYQLVPDYAPAYQGLLQCLQKMGREAQAQQIQAQVNRLR